MMPRLTFQGIVDCNKKLLKLKSLTPDLYFPAASRNDAITKVLIFLDASFNGSRSSSYGQTGAITGMKFRSQGADFRTIHMIDWVIE